MRRNRHIKVHLLLPVLFLWLALTTTTHAVTIASPPPLPTGITGADFEKLQRLNSSLDSQRQALQAAIGAFNTDCSRVPASDAPRVQSCSQRQKELLGRIADYRTAVDSYAQQVQLVSILSFTPPPTVDDVSRATHPTAQELLVAQQRIVLLYYVCEQLILYGFACFADGVANLFLRTSTKA